MYQAVKCNLAYGMMAVSIYRLPTRATTKRDHSLVPPAAFLLCFSALDAFTVL